ncbi:Uncharacterized protein PCOAH_00022740 [Plasmodium coatneyi]|uniref:Uncharacterized protein n=1 Tax=Plasmodium coatneyi TaxID=208452 RepID=A0A1B1DZ68_9APIC|nr:Uncharacterized protein PCOAH_00022740 [Plasmodium coatneyi]ANQ07909.1 Uncharacterized protein PCOAH_00022740 [Plasmodium coatneyi]
MNLVGSKRIVWGKELNRFSPIGNRKLHIKNSPNGEPHEDNNSGNHISEEKKKNYNFFKSLFVATFFFYTCYECLHIMKDHELVREKIKQLPGLSNFIDLKIMPLLVYLDGMVDKIKGYLLLIVKNGNYYSLHLWRSLKGFISKRDDKSSILVGPVEKRDLSEQVSSLKGESSVDVAGEGGDGEAGTVGTAPTANVPEDNFKDAHIKEKPSSELHSLISFDEGVHGVNNMPEEGTHYEGLPIQGTLKETEDANPVMETSLNGNIEEHPPSDDIKLVMDLLNKVNSPEGNEEENVPNLYGDDFTNRCPIDGYDGMRTGQTTIGNISDGEVTAHGEDEIGGTEDMLLVGQVEEMERGTHGHDNPNGYISADGDDSSKGKYDRADVPPIWEAQQPPLTSSVEETQKLFADGAFTVTEETHDEENREECYTNTHRQSAQNLIEGKEVCREGQKKDEDEEKQSTYEIDAEISPPSDYNPIEEEDTTEGCEPWAEAKGSNHSDDQYNPNAPQRNPQSGKRIKAVIAEGQLEIPLIDREVKGIVKSEVQKFKGEIEDLSKEELKDKIITMFLNELITKKYKNILMEEEKEALKRVLTVKYNDIYLREKKKMKKKLHKCIRKKLKEAEMLLKKSYESEKEIFSRLMRNQKKEEVKMEKNKIADELNRVRENYLSKINSYACDVDAMKDNHFREKVKMEKLETINDIQNKLVYLQNCIIQDLSIESILTDLKRYFKKDPFLDTVFTTLPDNFFSHTFKPTPNNMEKMKKEFYILYKEGVKEAFTQHNENYLLKKIMGRVASFFYLNYEPKMSILLHRALKDDCALKSNLVHLSYALSSVQQNQFVDALRYIDELTGTCKNTFLPFSEHVRNVVLFRYYLRLAVSRLMLVGKALRQVE